MKRSHRLAPSFLIAAAAIAAIAGVLQIRAQVPGVSGMQPTQPTQAAQPRELFIRVMEGEGALNDIRTRTAREPIVEVDDENHKPVAGAIVLFALNTSGSPYASFAGMPTLSVQTDSAGRAVGTGFRISSQKGSYDVHVQARYGAVTAETVIMETNVAVLFSENGEQNAVRAASHKKAWIVSSVLVAGAITGIVIATQQSSTSTISAGTGTVGAPAVVNRGLHFQLHVRQR